MIILSRKQFGELVKHAKKLLPNEDCELLGGKTIITPEFAEKFARLKNYLRELGSVAVAFSGGVDSTFLLKVAHEVLGDKAVALMAASAFVSRSSPRFKASLKNSDAATFT